MERKVFDRRAGATLEKVARALVRVGLSRNELILVGLSGGPDSVALTHILLALSRRFAYRLAAAHFNHRLRGAESERDEKFVRELCAGLGVELRVGGARELEVPAANLEERARTLRHDFLREAARELGATHIALGHHADDQAETVLLRLLRGAGAAGLGAMAMIGPGAVIRPMLELTRAEIVGYLEAVGARFVVDSSNASPAMLRNRVRLELIATLERDYAPGLRRRLVELAAEMRDLDHLVRTLARRESELRVGAAGDLDLRGFTGLDPALQRAVIRDFIAHGRGSLRGVGRSHVEAMCRIIASRAPSGQWNLPGPWSVRREYTRLRLVRERKGERQGARRFAVELSLAGTTVVEAAEFSFAAASIPVEEAAIPLDQFEALFDRSQLRGGLTVRNFVPGDRIAPLGLGGSRKVKRVFIDYKLPRARRATFPVVAAGADVAWLPGVARGSVALVTASTRHVLRVVARPLVAWK